MSTPYSLSTPVADQQDPNVGQSRSLFLPHPSHYWPANRNHTWVRQNIPVMPFGTGYNYHASQRIATVDANQFTSYYLPSGHVYGYNGFNQSSQVFPFSPTINHSFGFPEWQRNISYDPNVSMAVPLHFRAPTMPMPVYQGSDVSEQASPINYDSSSDQTSNDGYNGTVDLAVTNSTGPGSEISYTIYNDSFLLDCQALDLSDDVPDWLRAVHTSPFPRFYALAMETERHEKPIYLRYNESYEVPVLTNSEAPIVNAFIRAMVIVPVIKKLILSHLCRRPNCILCELQFITRNIHTQEMDAHTAPLTCTAIIREMAAYAEFASFKGITAKQFGGLSATLFTNFFFQHIFEESTNTYHGSAPENMHLNKAMCMNFDKFSTCKRCGSTSVSYESRHVVTLRYPVEEDCEHVPFIELLQGSYDDTTGADDMLVEQCNTCKRMAARTTKAVVSLPDVLVVDTAIDRYGYEFWNNNADLANNRPINSLDVYDYRFSRDGSTQFHPMNYHECTVREASDAVHCGNRYMHYIPSVFSAEIKSDGKVLFSSSMSKSTNKVYAFCSAVMSVADSQDKEHYISVCKNYNNCSPVYNFTVFNDYIVTPVMKDEALYTNAAWKMPHLLFYCDVDLLKSPIVLVQIPRAVFDDERPQNGQHERVPPPPSGGIVALDSEFIQNEIKEHVLGRVSCLNEEGKPIIDDYSLLCSNEQVGDYLTPYSGIVAEDLNPETSTKFLLSRKKSYLKLLYLLENRNVFVGHALHNDFRIFNIYIPNRQVIDTSLLYHLDGKKSLSLRSLVEHVFGEKIQVGQHDSIQDAMCALRLYKKFMKQQLENVNITLWLHEIYEETQKRLAQQRIAALRNAAASGLPPPYVYTSTQFSHK